jgi:hypothetical protein
MFDRKMVGERGNRALRTHNPPQQPTSGAIQGIVAPRTIGRIAIRIVNDNRQTSDNLVPGAVITRTTGGNEIPETHRAVDVGGDWARAAPRIGDRAASDTHDARQPVGGIITRMPLHRPVMIDNHLNTLGAGKR